MWQRLFFRLFIIRRLMWSHCHQGGVEGGVKEKNLLRRGRLGKTAATCIISKGKLNNDGIRGVHKVALRNSPAAWCLLFAARLPYIIKAGICICLHSVASWWINIWWKSYTAIRLAHLFLSTCLLHQLFVNQWGLVGWVGGLEGRWEGWEWKCWGPRGGEVGQCWDCRTCIYYHKWTLWISAAQMSGQRWKWPTGLGPERCTCSDEQHQQTTASL